MIKLAIFTSARSDFGVLKNIIESLIYDKRFSLLHLNPGAAGKIGFHKKRTMIKFEIDGINIKNIFVIELGNRSTINVNDL